MKDFRFSVPQDITFGEGSLAKLPEILKKQGAAKALLVSDRGLEKLGVVEKVKRIAEEAGITVAEFLDVEPNPSVHTVDRAVQA